MGGVQQRVWQGQTRAASITYMHHIGTATWKRLERRGVSKVCDMGAAGTVGARGG